MGKRCPGAVQGILVVDMTSRIRGPREDSQDSITRVKSSSWVELNYGTSAPTGSVRPPVQTQNLAQNAFTQVDNREFESA